MSTDLPFLVTKSSFSNIGVEVLFLKCTSFLHVRLKDHLYKYAFIFMDIIFIMCDHSVEMCWHLLFLVSFSFYVFLLLF